MLFLGLINDAKLTLDRLASNAMCKPYYGSLNHGLCISAFVQKIPSLNKGPKQLEMQQSIFY